MKRIFTFCLIVFVLHLGKTNAQTTLATFSVSDLNSYMNAYVGPFAKAMPIGLSGGWAHTAKTHSSLGFDITFSASAISIPSSESTIKANSIDLPSPFSFSDANADVPTIRGKNSLPAPSIEIPLQAGTYTTTLEFPAFKGIGMGLSASAALQLGVGLPKGTELMVRFIPDLSTAANNLIPSGTDVKLEKTGLWGVGVKHDIKQWIPVVSKLPFLQISGLLAYTRFYTGFSGGDLTVTPTTLGVSAGDLASNTALWEDQKFNMKVSSFTGSLLVGASIPVFQPFIGLGFNSGKFESGFYGTYPIVSVSGTTGNLEVNDSEKDPLVIKNNKTNFNFQAGARLKLGPVVIHYALSLQNGYKMHTGGLGVTIR